MGAAKISFSKKETGLLLNSGWILTKNDILQRIVRFLSELQREQMQIHAGRHGCPAEWKQAAPKISRGENYLGLPWVVLDYPRAYGGGSFAAIRTLFWWGHFFSVTLHLSGTFKENARPLLLRAQPQLSEAGFSVSTGTDEWNHRMQPGNYRPAGEWSPQEWEALLSEKSFWKASLAIPLQEMEEMPERLLRAFAVIMECLQE